MPISYDFDIVNIMRSTKPTTSAQYSIIFWCFLFFFVVCGALCLFVGYGVSPEKIQEVFQLHQEPYGYSFVMTNTKLIWLGYGFMAIAILMYIIRCILLRSWNMIWFKLPTSRTFKSNQNTWVLIFMYIDFINVREHGAKE